MAKCVSDEKSGQRQNYRAFQSNERAHTQTYLIWEKFHEEGAQKNDAQTLWIQFTFHQADTGSNEAERKDEDKSGERKKIKPSSEACCRQEELRPS